MFYVSTYAIYMCRPDLRIYLLFQYLFHVFCCFIPFFTFDLFTVLIIVVKRKKKVLKNSFSARINPVLARGQTKDNQRQQH